jgi:hypothetical protein
MRSRLLRKIGSIIGLLAVLMTTLAPTVSQALAANTRVESQLSVYCSASTGLRTQAGGRTASHQGGIGHWEACGYCSLAAHVPVMPPLQAVKPPLPTQQFLPPAQLADRFVPHGPIFAAQPRAPPASA